jgi:hypothetical protein
MGFSQESTPGLKIVTSALLPSASRQIIALADHV